MAFIKMRNLYGREIKISKSAANSYKNLGFYPVDEDELKKEETHTDGETTAHDGGGKSDDEIFAETIRKKPLASWNKDEVKRYAAICNIDITGTKSANEAKERIKEYMSEF